MNRKWWTLGRGERGDVHAPARHHRRQHGAARDPAGPRRQLHRSSMGDRRLRPLARGAGADRGVARRPARAPARVRDRAGDLLRRLAAVRAGPGPDLPERRARPSRGSAGRSCSPSRSPWSRRSSRPAASAGWRWASTARRSASPSPIGPLVGGLLTDGLGWESVFLLNVPIGIAAVADHLLEGGRVARPQRDPGRLGRARHVLDARCSCWCWRWCAATTRAGAAR